MVGLNERGLKRGLRQGSYLITFILLTRDLSAMTEIQGEGFRQGAAFASGKGTVRRGVSAQTALLLCSNGPS